LFIVGPRPEFARDFDSAVPSASQCNTHADRTRPSAEIVSHLHGLRFSLIMGI
jgi:hypothetical protein